MPSLLMTWQLHDWQTGSLISCLFVGSFSGTMMLSGNLGRTLKIGASTASVGAFLFALMAHRATGFPLGAIALVLFGYGLGQLMSSINLIVGSAPAEVRSQYLAKIGVAWCSGAVFSPLLTTVLFVRLNPAVRVGLFALVYLLPLIFLNGRSLPVYEKDSGCEVCTNRTDSQRKLALLCIAAFLIYGGIESNIGGWMSLFALRYRMSTIGAAQWAMSFFWGGLIAGRLLTARFVTPRTEVFIVRLSIICAICSLWWLIGSPSSASLMMGGAITGAFLGPLFPLFLSATIECRFGSRIMGSILAASGLGAALFPFLLGVVSNVWSLRAAMLLPLMALLLLLLIRWYPPNRIVDSRLL